MELNTIRAESIVLDIQSTQKRDAIQELLRRAEIFDCIDDVEVLADSVLDREERMSTGFGRGVAIAHGNSSCIDHVIVALGLSKSGVEFDSADGRPVHILFVVVNPVSEQTEYLDVLSTLTAILRSDEVRGRLRKCSCTVDVEATFRQAANGGDTTGRGVCSIGNESESTHLGRDSR